MAFSAVAADDGGGGGALVDFHRHVGNYPAEKMSEIKPNKQVKRWTIKEKFQNFKQVQKMVHIICRNVYRNVYIYMNSTFSYTG